MLNLTENAVTLIAESGETTTIPPSGYVARVVSTWDEVSSWHNAAPDQEFDVPIIEETPTEICFHNTQGFEGGLIGTWTRENPSGLLLVPREVAEAAHVLRHPLAERMVWVDDGKFGIVNHDDGTFSSRQTWRSLRRVSRGNEK